MGLRAKLLPASLSPLAPAVAYGVVGVLFFAATIYRPPETGETTVVFAPGVSEAEAWGRVIAAGGYVVSSTLLSNVVIAYAGDNTFGPRVLSRGGLTFSAAPGLCLTLAAQETAPS